MDDGVAAHDAVWALFQGGIEVAKARPKQDMRWLADGLRSEGVLGNGLRSEEDMQSEEEV